MTNAAILKNGQQMQKSRPEVRPGYTVRVHERIKEGEKERVQIFEGLVISVHKGSNPMDTTFTVRRIVSGIGTEKIFPLHSPKLEKVEVKKVATVRRAKLFFLRGRTGKAARLSERFTNAGEFGLLNEIEGEADTEEETEDMVEATNEVPTEAETNDEVTTEDSTKENKAA